MRNLAALAACIAATGCLGMSGVRNGPVRNVMRSRNRVVAMDLQTVTVENLAPIPDGDRHVGYGIGGKSGVAFGGSESTSHGGYAQDFTAFIAIAFGRFYLAPQLGFFMNLHGSDMMGKGQTALGLPIEIDGGIRVLDRVTLYVGGGRSLWGHLSDGDVGESATLWRGRVGTMLVLRDGVNGKREVTLRLEGFTATGSGEMLDYDAVGSLLQLDITWAGAGY